MKNTSGFNIGDRIKMKSSVALQLSIDIEGSYGTVIDIYSSEKYPWLNELDGNKAIVRLDSGIRCGEFAKHSHATEGCVCARLHYNAVLVGSPTLNIEEII